MTTEALKAQFPDLEWYKIPTPEDHPAYIYHGFEPGKTVLPKGHVRFPGRRAFPIDVILDRDVAIPMRDGVVLYADIFRSVESDQSEKVPAIIPWSPYGKTGTGTQHYDNMAPFRAGLPLDKTSGYEKFEAPDPAEWVQRGYAIVNVDARGINRSGGEVVFWGQQEAEDIYDTIDWLAKQPWCNGSVGMAGNSWLSIAQVNYASRLEHPALKALAPWECFTDPYRDLVARGGRKHNEGFHNLLLTGFAGPQTTAENLPGMIAKRPLYDEYWESKYIHTENITVPLYILASYSTMLHTRGSLQTFRTARSAHKWLRVHPHQEWYDLYRPEIVDDLQRYFDRFLKGIDNGWEHDTPPVRLSLLGFEASGSPATTIRERAEQEYPLARQTLKTFYLNAMTKSLQADPVAAAASVSHAGHDLQASSDFTLFFDGYTEIAGYAKVRLWMCCQQHDDMDVAVQIRKISAQGIPLAHLNYPCPDALSIDDVPDVNTAKTLGPQGFLRASHSISRDASQSTEQEIFYRHDRREPVGLGTIVPLEITLWPMGMVFAPGEGIMLRVSGHDMCLPEVELIRPTTAEDENVGEHEIHAGGRYDSCLVLPFL
ncbi:hypothetical protein ASPZODRAFT_2051812 [Penicilliopsis zonata CBS 506.65]|uniref:Xaa-Pro dipeptidyl-peptidase C-terminal domain-containing protein n=1 Tax=Penicilliopsis zonata CBS 506.65 TaxID=1073090 RepID=A0A1L9SFY3_9EURO|nr:hypothetical protein ASPZODRAFT_2051812 [Penicilliopsis zonata CBS 506.65]OJJ46081.1 hypothetical protein ASPZODRAFT_2051812 [Penicilliopsis zonata CBS 506.65]